VVLVFRKGDDSIDAINHMMSFLTSVVNSRYPATNNQLRTSSNPRQQATINDGRVTIQPIQGRHNHISAGSSRPFASGSGGTSRRQRVIVCYNCKGEGHMAKQCTKPKRKRDAEWFKDKRDTWSSQKSALTFAELFKINNLKAQAQAKDTVILKLKEKLNSLNGDVKDRHVKRDVEEIETLNIELDHKVTKLAAENEHFKQTYKQLYDSVKSSRVQSKEQCDDLINKVNLKSAEVSDLNASLQEKVLVKFLRSKDETPDFIIKILKLIQVRLKVPVRRQFCDSGLEVAFRQHTCFIRNLEGVDLLTGSRGNNLYTLSLQDMMASSPICLLSKASKTKSLLWHYRLSHLNFGAINHLARQGLVRVEPKTYKEALTQACWIEAMQEELHEFERLEVWELVPRPDKVMVITLKWIYKVKLDELGGILKNKAHLVARGYRQEEGIDFEDSFAPEYSRTRLGWLPVVIVMRKGLILKSRLLRFSESNIIHKKERQRLTSDVDDEKNLIFLRITDFSDSQRHLY
nr:integrase, catalytic region, zinc finger, CCHC-type, peptidase aspartic, catalytic [Tanacetum cinerariifolium]